MRDFAGSEAGRLLIASWFKELCPISRGWQDVERHPSLHKHCWFKELYHISRSWQDVE